MDVDAEVLGMLPGNIGRYLQRLRATRLKPLLWTSRSIEQSLLTGSGRQPALATTASTSNSTNQASSMKCETWTTVSTGRMSRK